MKGEYYLFFIKWKCNKGIIIGSRKGFYI